MLMLGYANRPEATAAAIVDGGYRTGDGGYLDEAGCKCQRLGIGQMQRLQ